MAQTHTYTQVEAMVYQTLMQPESDAPNRIQVWNAINAQAQMMFAALQNTDIPSGTEVFRFQTTAQQAEYLVTAADFGKDILIRTRDTANPYHAAREIKRVRPQDVNLHFNGPSTAITSGHSAVCASMRRDAQMNAYITLYPTPADTVEYEMLYETDSGVFGSVGDAFKYPNFVHLLRYRAALELLPYCKWSNLSAAESAERMKMLGASLGLQDQRNTKEYEAWLDNDHQPGSFHRAGYAEDYF